MKKYHSGLWIAFLFFSLFCSGCAFGPLYSQESARTVGEDNHEILAAYGHASYLLKWNYGVTENLDFGVHVEALSVGIRGKYAFFQNQMDGWSLAGALGIGSSFGGSHQYADLTASYIFTKWEPYATVRFVHISIDPVEARDSSTGDVFFRTDRSEYDYGHAFLGSRYWFTNNWNLTLEASTLFAVTEKVTINENILGGLAVGYRF